VKPIHLNQDLREFLGLLGAADVKYLVIGGYAVAAHGHPRNTKDIDIWFETSPANADRLLSVLRDFGFGALAITQADFLTPDGVIQLGYPPNRIDLISTPAGVDFAECYAQRVVIRVDGIAVNFIDADHLKQNKLAAGRKQDLADVEALSGD
jgi:hypothetical protein